jgi:hypothetical protein
MYRERFSSLNPAGAEFEDRQNFPLIFLNVSAIFREPEKNFIAGPTAHFSVFK